VLKPHLKSTKSPATSPNYVGLVRFLIEPFLESKESLSIDCEISPTLQRAWIRIAFDSNDKGKVFGRGGRNIQAIRTVIAAAAQSAGQSAYLDIYGAAGQGREGMSFDEDVEERIPPPRARERRTDDGGSRPFAKPRSRTSLN
jgi:hypothetical protein